MLPNRPQVVVALVLGLVILGLLVFSLFTAPLPAGDIEAIDAGPVAVGMTLFERYVLPLEVTSILLLVAMIGVVVFRARTRQRREDA